MIPKDPTWCSYCIDPAAHGLAAGEPCPDHRGPDGKPALYTGRDAYEPTAWVREVVGRRYAGWDVGVYECFGYDPRNGFWMRRVDGDRRQINVSERAIGRTFHEVRMSGAAWELLKAWIVGADDPAGVDVERARQTLMMNGYLDAEGSITEAGRAAAATGAP